MKIYRAELDHGFGEWYLLSINKSIEGAEKAIREDAAQKMIEIAADPRHNEVKAYTVPARRCKYYIKEDMLND